MEVHAPVQDIAPAQGKRVLLIEDCESIARLSKMILESMGHEVRIALDGRDGVAQATQYRPDVILCDMSLGSAQDGCAVARELRRNPWTRDISIFAVTAYRLEDCEERALEAGFSLVVSKPVDFEWLNQKMALVK